MSNMSLDVDLHDVYAEEEIFLGVEIQCLFDKEKALDGIYKRGYFTMRKNKNDCDFGDWELKIEMVVTWTANYYN